MQWQITIAINATMQHRVDALFISYSRSITSNTVQYHSWPLLSIYNAVSYYRCYSYCEKVPHKHCNSYFYAVSITFVMQRRVTLLLLISQCNRTLTVAIHSQCNDALPLLFTLRTSTNLCCHSKFSVVPIQLLCSESLTLSFTLQCSAIFTPLFLLQCSPITVQCGDSLLLAHIAIQYDSLPLLIVAVQWRTTVAIHIARKIPHKRCHFIFLYNSDSFEQWQSILLLLLTILVPSITSKFADIPKWISPKYSTRLRPCLRRTLSNFSNFWPWFVRFVKIFWLKFLIK
jgi:hypothetical protein